MRTIKTGSIIIILLFLSSGINAQKINYGIQGGLNGALQSKLGALYDNSDFRTSYRVGVFTNYELNDKFKAQVELNYDRRGSEDEEVLNSYDYLAVPILANYQLHKGMNTPWSFDVFLGPNTAFLINAKTSFDNKENQDIDQFDHTKKVELGAMGGFIVRYPILNNNLILNINYSLGLTRLNDLDSEVRNKIINLSIGYEF